MNSWLLNRWGQTERRQRTQKKAGRRDAARRRVLFERLEDRSLMAGLVSPVLDTTIEAVNLDQNVFNNNNDPIFSPDGQTPPDPHGAVGPTHVVNMVNQTIQWFTKQGVQQGQTSLTNFYAPLFPAPGLGPFDPKIVYDHNAGRFVAVALELLDTGFGDAVNSSRILIAVSDDSDPNGNWHYQSINSQMNIGGAAQWFDYPGLAIDSKAIYITGNMFPFSTAPATAAFGGSRLWIIGKGQGTGGLYDGGISSANVYNPAGVNAATSGFTLQPATMFGTGPSMGNQIQTGTWLIAYNGTSNGTTESVLTIRVDNPLNNPTFFQQTISVGDIDDTLNTAYPTILGPLALPGAPQRGTTTLLDFIDRRMMSAVWRNNQLYATTQVLPGSGPDTNQVTVHWFRIDTTNPNQLVLADQGNVGGEDVGSNVFTSFGAVMVDAAGNMAIGFAASGPALYGGAYYTVRAANDPPGTTRGARALALGQDAYEDGSDPSRWGDYSGIALDPTDQVTFWIYNEYAQARSNGTTAIPDDQGRYGTRWGAFHLAALPPPTDGGGGATTSAFVTGVKWSDTDKDGVFDSTEKGVAGFTMYVDLNSNDKIDIGEPAATTDADGRYVIESQKFGTFAIREVPLPGWVQIYPGAAVSYEHVVTLVSGQTVSGIDFGNNGQVYDFGDAPAPYPTLLKDNGARAPVLAGFHLGPPSVSATGVALGVEPDTEANGLPDASALGDDSSGTDDEDGVVFGSAALLAGGTGTVTVTVSTGTNPSGALQAWIDFNGDGDWNDSGEQIIKNKALAEGAYTLSFAVPASAKIGLTGARFRYGYEKDLGPTGSSVAGEVEDYMIQVITDEPVATPDAAQVIQGSNNNQIDVLANDFASSAGGLRIQSVVNPTQQNGTAVLFDRGTTNPLDDVVLYTPPFAGFIGTDNFNYTITDNSGKTSTATVTVTVVSATSDPIAVDDSFALATAQVTTLNVRANDIVGKNPPILITGVTQPPSGQGVVTITSGGQLLQYAPPATTFVGDLQFTYTISDAASPTPKSSTATVTLHVGGSTADDIIGFSLRTFDTNGNPISVIAPGQDFELQGYAQDLRTDDTVGNPTDRLGVYAAYFDTLYSSNLVSIIGPVTFEPPFTSGQSAGTSTPGLLDEVGAFLSGTNPPLTPDARLLFSVRMRANVEGQATFTSDPADNLPLHDSLVFEPPTPPVSFQQITYGSSTLFIGNPATVLFKAVDDSLTASATGPTTLQVLNNDLVGLNGPISITTVTTVGAFQGSVVRSGDAKTVIYTAPAGGFTGVQQFDYTIQNTAGGTSTARATIFAGNPTALAANDKVRIRLVAWDPVANQTITSINQGKNFQIRAYVTDLRTDDQDGDPTTDRRGVFAAYSDVLYNYKVATFVPNATDSTGFFFDPEYRNGRSGNADTPGLLDEVGAFQSGSLPLGGSEELLFAATFKADKAGTFTFSANPADASPLHDVLLFNPPTPPVSINEITYTLGGSLTINPTGSGGEAEFTNGLNPLDVNADGYVTPIDALLVINNMNAYGSRALTSGSNGEAGAAKLYLDVNADKYLSALDALLVVNYLNRHSGGGGEGEGEGTLDPGVGISPAAILSPESSTLIVTPTASEPAPAVAPAATSGAASSLLRSSPRTSNVLVVSNSEEDQPPQATKSPPPGDSLEQLLDDLASDVAGAWDSSRVLI